MGVTDVIDTIMATSALAIDCEMVGGRRMKKRRVPSRVYIVNDKGECIYDTYINCELEVDCEETWARMASGQSLRNVKTYVKKVIKNRLLIGRNVKTDLKLIGINHPKDNMILDENGYLPTEKVGDDGSYSIGMNKVITNSLSLYCETVMAVRLNTKPRDLPGRVSLVNQEGICVYDTYITQDLGIFKIIDYRTSVSGLTRELMAGGKPMKIVKKQVAGLIKKLVLVGHDVVKDLKALNLAHPEWNKMDTAEYRGFQDLGTGGKPSLKLLAKAILDMDIQQGAHSSLEDAQVAMKLFRTVGNKWEEDKIKPKKNKRKTKMIPTIRAVNQSD